MQVEYKNKSLEKVCTDASAAIKKYNTRMAEKIQQRITEIKASDSVEQMLQYHIGRCHLLKGDLKGLYAMDLIHPFRLIFEKKGEEIQIAKITDITDYH